MHAGEELNFLGKASHLRTASSSFKYVPSDTIGVAKAVGTRTGFLEASQMENHRKPRKLSSKGASRSNSKQKVGGVSSKVAIDVIPFHSTNYLPQVDDVVLGVVVQKN